MGDTKEDIGFVLAGNMKGSAKPALVIVGAVFFCLMAYTVFAAQSEDQVTATTMTVVGLVDTTLNCTTFSFGTNLDPDTSDNPAVGNPPCQVVNTANSNVAVDIYLNASNMTYSTTQISFRNLSVWTSNAAGSSVRMNATNMGDGAMYLNSSTTCGGTPCATGGFIENLAISGTVNLFLWQDVPLGTIPGAYSGKMTVHSVQDGQPPV